MPGVWSGGALSGGGAQCVERRGVSGNWEAGWDVGMRGDGGPDGRGRDAVTPGPLIGEEGEGRRGGY